MPGYGSQSKRGKLLSAGLVIQILDLPASYKWFRRVRGPAATQANLGYFENLECDKIDRIRDQGCRSFYTNHVVKNFVHKQLTIKFELAGEGPTTKCIEISWRV